MGRGRFITAVLLLVVMVVTGSIALIASDNLWGFLLLVGSVVGGLIIYFLLRTEAFQSMFRNFTRSQTRLTIDDHYTSPPEPIVGTLYVQVSDDPTVIAKQLELTAHRYTIGRVPESDIVISSEKVSRVHARIHYVPEKGFVIEDVHSTHGTKINERKLKPGVLYILAEGDVIAFGDNNKVVFHTSVSSQRYATDQPPQSEIIIDRSRLIDTETDMDTDDPGQDLFSSRPIPPKSAALPPGNSERSSPKIGKVGFSAYVPPTVAPNIRYSLFTYAYKADSPQTAQAVTHNVQKFTEELGGVIPNPKVAPRLYEIEEQIPITIVPTCDEVTFDPPSLTKKWTGDWVRFEFDFKPTVALLNTSLWIRLSIQICGIEIGFIKAAAEVAEKAPPPMAPPPPKTKHGAQSMKPYRKIFVSYSRRDHAIVEAYRIAQLAIGDEVFMDTYSIRTGEQWEDALKTAIKSADVFQLFWSEHSAASPHVSEEWKYALAHRCEENDCKGFIRPVFWVKPMPVTPPPQLSHLNFTFCDLTKLVRGETPS